MWVCYLLIGWFSQLLLGAILWDLLCVEKWFFFDINSSLAKNNILSHACLRPRSAAECVLELRVAVKETGQSVPSSHPRPTGSCLFWWNIWRVLCSCSSVTQSALARLLQPFGSKIPFSCRGSYCLLHLGIPFLFHLLASLLDKHHFSFFVSNFSSVCDSLSCFNLLLFCI